MAPPVPALAAAASEAPEGPGVYYLLGPESELLYVGKAANLRRRLGRHADPDSGAGGSVRPRYQHVRRVVLEPRADEQAAAVRHADVVVALRPPLNDVDAGQGWNYVVVRPAASVEEAVEVVRVPGGEGLRGERRGGRVFGCFPHLGSTLGLRPSLACGDGYAALLRLLAAAAGGAGGGREPGAGMGSIPEGIEVGLDREAQASLQDLLSGRGNGLLRRLAGVAGGSGRHVQATAARDLEAAQSFFRHGPRALRRLAARHAQPPGPVAREVFERLVAAEVRALVGDVRLPADAPPAPSRAS